MKKESENPFSVLELTASASAAEVKKAYRRLVATWHPDRFAQDSVPQRLAQERLKEINAAYADCLKLLSLRRGGGNGITTAAPLRKKGTSTAATKSGWSEPAPARPQQPPLAMWPNVALAALLVAGWLIGLHRYGFGAAFLQFVGLLAIVPSIAAFWYNARLLRGRLMLILYVSTVTGAGLFLVLSQALYEQQMVMTVPSWQGGGEAVRGFGAAGSVGAGGFSIVPPSPVERGLGPIPPQVMDPAAPLAPMAPLAPLVPRAPQAR